MNDQLARSLFMDYLYDEISDTEKLKLEAYLDDNPRLKEELNELKQTRSLLQQAPEVELKKDLALVEPRKRSFADWWQDAKVIFPRSGWGKTALVTAACLVLLLVSASVAELNIQSNEAGFSISFGETVQPQTTELTAAQTEAIARRIQKNNQWADATDNANKVTKKDAEKFLTEPEAETLLAKTQRQNKALLASFAKEMNRQNKQQLQQIVKYFQAQRIYDLKRIKQGLNKVELAGAYRWQQTNQMLDNLIQTASVKQ